MNQPVTIAQLERMLDCIPQALKAAGTPDGTLLGVRNALTVLGVTLQRMQDEIDALKRTAGQP